MAVYKTTVTVLLTRMDRFDNIGGHLSKWYEHAGSSSYYRQHQDFDFNRLALGRPHMIPELRSV